MPYKSVPITRLIAVAALALLAALAYGVLKPVPIEPVVWDAPTFKGYAPPHATNTDLGQLTHIDLGGEQGPEHVAAHLGKLYISTQSGNVMRMNFDGTGREVWLKPGGKVLGFDFDAKGEFIAACVERGLIAVGADRVVRVLARSVPFQGKPSPIVFADAVVVSPNGRIYFSDASTRFGAKQWGGPFEASVLDILEQSATGRVLEHDPATGRTRVVAHGLSFANGLALSADAQHLLVNETGPYRMWRIDVNAQERDVRAGPSPQARVLLSNLPGYPDNIMRGPDVGGQASYWVGLAKPRSYTVDAMAQHPWLRKLTLRLPRSLWPIPPAHGHVFQINEKGDVLKDLQDPSGAYPETTGATQVGKHLYIHSLHANTLGLKVLP